LTRPLRRGKRQQTLENRLCRGRRRLCRLEIHAAALESRFAARKSTAPLGKAFPRATEGESRADGALAYRIGGSRGIVRAWSGDTRRSSADSFVCRLHQSRRTEDGGVPSVRSHHIVVGDEAPGFTVLDDTGKSVSLADFRGHAVVLYFYPKDNTPGCTAEACSLRDAFPAFGKLDAVVLGVSPDSWRKHKNFKKKYDLPFTLLADPDHAVTEQYGLWAKKLFWGRHYWGVLRTTFIIDERGVIAKVFEEVDVERHGQDVAEALAALRR
jgi:peroxiredoxin Q/BCP